MNENDEILMENVSPEDLPSEEQKQEKPFVPSAPWKRALAWFLFVVVVLGIAVWLLNIACPQWVETVKGWLGA